MIRQLEKDDCGAAVLRYVLKARSHDRNYAFYPPRRRCDSLLSIKDELQSRGLNSTGVALDRSDLSAVPPGSILRSDRLGHNHFWVLVSRKKDCLVMFDPNRGRVRLRPSDSNPVFTSALIIKEGRPEPLARLKTVSLKYRLALSLISIMECGAAALTLVAADRGLWLWSILGAALILLLAGLHWWAVKSKMRHLDEKFLLTYLNRFPKERDYGYLLSIRTKIALGPAQVYGTIAGCGLIFFLLLTLGLPLFIGSLTVGVAFAVLAYLTRRWADKCRSVSAAEEDEFRASMRRQKIDRDKFFRSSRYGDKYAGTIFLRWMLKGLICGAVSMGIMKAQSRFSLDSFIAQFGALLLIGNLAVTLATGIKNLEPDLQELSRLNPYAYELLCEKNRDI